MPAERIWDEIAYAAWACADPGVQYDTTINEWHTCPEDGRINASNPCVTGETLVATGEGWQRIDSLVGKTARVIGADGEPHLVTRIFPTGHKPVFDLRTRLGYQVRITGDHRVLTVGRGDVAVADHAVHEDHRRGPVGCRAALEPVNRVPENRGAEHVIDRDGRAQVRVRVARRVPPRLSGRA